MTVYAIILVEPSEEAWERVRRAWPDEHIFHTDQIALINEKKATTTQHVAQLVGLDPDGKIRGMVFDATYIAGWGSSSLAEWLGRFHE